MLMMPVEWTPDDLVFSRQLDRDHQKVFARLEKVRKAIDQNTPADQLAFDVWRLSKDLSIHLASEERLMRECRYPAKRWHESQHEAGRHKMHRLKEAARSGESALQAAAIEELAKWLKDHVHLADRMLAAHLRNDRRERLVS